MKKLLIFFSLLLSFYYSYSQSEKSQDPFENGFRTGFKEGYCYGNQTFNCFTPSIPLTPLPNLNERKENYRDGYNRGFQLGLDLKRVATGGGTMSPSGVPYSAVPNYKFNDYIPQIPVDAYLRAAQYKQKVYDANVEWIQNRMDNVKQLNQLLLGRLNPDYYEAINKAINAYLKSAARSDFSLPSVINQIKSMLNEKEREIYREYQRSMEEANSITIDLNENPNNRENINGLITKRIRTTKYGSHVFYFYNNLKDTLTDDENVLYGVLDNDENGVLLFYQKENKSYYWMDASEYYNQSIGSLIKLNYLSTTSAVAINFRDEKGNPKMRLLDEGNAITADWQSDKYLRTKQGNYSRFIIYKNSEINKLYYVPMEISIKDDSGNPSYYKPYPVFSR